jgi:hypothetical protein
MDSEDDGEDAMWEEYANNYHPESDEWPTRCPKLSREMSLKVEQVKRQRLDSWNLTKLCTQVLAKMPGTPLELVQRLDGCLLLELIEEVLQDRAKGVLSRALKSRGMDFEQIALFLSCAEGLMFGSCPLAGILGENWFGDVDVMVPGNTENNDVRWWAVRIFPDQNTEETYAPRMVCEHAAKANGDPVLFEYHRTHRTDRGSIDVVQTSDMQKLLDCRNLDTDMLVFNGERFHYPLGSLVDFVRSRSCRIVSTGYATAFEGFYDPWCQFCDEGGHLTTDYQEVHDADNESPVGVEKIRQCVLEETDPVRFSRVLPSWISRSDFEDLVRLRDIVVPRFKELEPTSSESGLPPLSEYLVLKLFLRLVKLQLRGISCCNFSEVFAPEPLSAPTPNRLPLKSQRNMSSVLVNDE